MKKLEEYELDSEYKAEVRKRLFNYILKAVNAHSITLEDLEVVMDMFEVIYKNEATIKSDEVIIKPLNEIN